MSAPLFDPVPPAELLYEEFRMGTGLLTAGDLRRRVPLKPKALAGALAELVAAGRVQAWSGKRYALESETAFVGRQILGALAAGRLQYGELSARLSASGVKPAQLKAALAEQAAAGAVYLAGTGARQLISSEPLPPLAETLRRVASQEPISKKELAARACQELPWHRPAEAAKAITTLLAEGALREHKAARLLFASPADPEAFLRRVAQKAYDETYAAWSGILGQAPPAAPLLGPDEFLDAMLKVEPQKGMLVTMRQLRESPWLRGVPKPDFDRAVLQLARDRKVYIAPHPAPAHLSPEEREFLVRDEKGVYYGGLSWRD